MKKTVLLIMLLCKALILLAQDKESVNILNADSSA